VSFLRKTLRVILWTIGVIIAVPIVLYLVVLAINLRDQPPSTQALALAAAQPDAADIADSDNAYVFLLGFGSPRDGDPAVIGAARAAWLRKIRNDESLPRDPDPYILKTPRMSRSSSPRSKSYGNPATITVTPVASRHSRARTTS